MGQSDPDSGCCVRCDRDGWTRATWVRGRGPICSTCLPIPPPRRRRTDDEDGDAARPATKAKAKAKAKPRSAHGTGGRHLSRREASLAYPGCALSANYGKPRGEDGVFDTLPDQPPTENAGKGAA
jgi:hypothetical protein